MEDLKIGELVLVTPANGPTMLGRVKDTTDDLKCSGTWTLEDAIICERMQIPRGGGQFDLSYLTMPLDVFDMIGKTARCTPAAFIVVDDKSKLASLYTKTLEDWRIKRSGIVPATQADVTNIFSKPRGGAN